MDWKVWRLVSGKIATLPEIETYYSWLDVELANESLDINIEMMENSYNINE